MADSPRIDELKRRVQTDPASIAFAALAEEYRRAGRFDEAVATCRAGLQRHPAYLSAHVTLGRAYLELGQYDEARHELEHVLRSAPENLAAIRGLAEIHHRRGDLASALKQYEAALNVAPHDLELQDTVAAIKRDLARQAPPQSIHVDLGTGVPAFDLAIAGHQSQSSGGAAPLPLTPAGDALLAPATAAEVVLTPAPPADVVPAPAPAVEVVFTPAPPIAVIFTPAPPVEVVTPAPAAEVVVTSDDAEVVLTSHDSAAGMPAPQPATSGEPALAGLEEFLAAIVRARRERRALDPGPDSAAVRR